MATFNFSRGLALWIGFLSCSHGALAQSLLLIEIENGDFENAPAADPDDPFEDGFWEPNLGGLPFCSWDTDLFLPAFAGDNHMISTSFFQVCSAQTINYDILGTLTPQQVQESSFELPYASRNHFANTEGRIDVVWMRADGSEIIPLSSTGDLPSAVPWQYDSLTHPWLRGTIPDDAASFRIEIFCSAVNGFNRVGCIFDEIGPMTFIVPDGAPEPPPVDDPPADDPPADDPPDDDLPEGDFPVDADDVLEAIAIGEELIGNVCDNLPDLTGLGFAPSAFGGSGIGGQIAQLFGQVEANCLAQVQIDATTNPDGIADIAPPDIFVDPLNPSILEGYQNATIGFEDGQDVVTASNRTNQLIRIQTQYQLAQNERIFGSGPLENYETDRGPRITDEDLAQETNFEFAEGDYSQILGRTGALVDAENIQPDFSRRADLDDAFDAVTGDGAFFIQNIDPPTADGFEGAFQTIRWNAANTIGGSEIGAFIGSLATTNQQNITELCFGPTSGLSVSGSIGGQVQVVEANPVCVYGPRAPSYLNFMFGLMPTIMLMFAGVAVFKMFVG